MHPKMMIALANEVERDRQREREQVERRSLARADRSAGSPGFGSASPFARLIAGISLRPRLS
jgi:hypothetical protein